MNEAGGSSDYFPESGHLFLGGRPVRYERFAELRESLMYDLADSGITTATLMAYWGDLESLFLWCLQEEVDVLVPSTSDLAGFLESLREQQYSLNTIARYITSFRRFYDFLVDTGECDRSPMVGIHQRRPRPPRRRSEATPLTARQRDRMLKVASDARDTAVLSLLFSRLSVSQLCAAKVADFGDGPVATLATAYRGIPETVTLTDGAASAVRKYLDKRAVGPLIVAANGLPLDRFDVNRLLARIAKHAGIRSPVGPARLPQRASRAARASRQTSSTDR